MVDLIVDAAHSDAQVTPSVQTDTVQESADKPKRTRRTERTEPEAVQDDAPTQDAQIVQDATPAADTKAQALQMAQEGMTVADIARTIGANYNTVRSWVKRANIVQMNGKEG